MSHDYVRESWCPCADCRTVRPRDTLQASALEPDAPPRLVCIDRTWCLTMVKRNQEKEDSR